MAAYFVFFAAFFIVEKLWEKLGDYVVEKIVVYTVAPIRDYLVAPIRDYWVSHIGRPVGYLLSYNMEVFRNGLENLGIIRDKVQGRVDAAVRQGKDILPKVLEWLTSVKEITEEDSSNLFDDNNYNLQVNLNLRYQLSKNAEERAAVVDELMREGSSFDRVSTCAEMFESRRSNLRNKKMQASKAGMAVLGALGSSPVQSTVSLGLTYMIELICPKPPPPPTKKKKKKKKKPRIKGRMMLDFPFTSGLNIFILLVK